VLAGAAAGAVLSIVVSVSILPLQIVSRERAKDVGLVTQSWQGYARDKSISWGIGAVIAGLGAATAVGLIRRYPRGWWVPGSVLVVAFGVVSIYAGPVVLDPIFNKFQALPAGQTRSDVLELAERAGVDIGEVYSVDASRRSTAANAYVAGLGSTKRVVLYDTLLENFERDEVRLVVAHELAHQHHRDVPNGLLYVAIVAPFGLLAVAQLTRRLAPDAEPGPAMLPALALSLIVMTTAITTISNQLSRQVEARADTYALTLTGEPKPFIGFERRIALRNLSDPDPPGWQTALLATHPPTIERIGIGVAYERGAR
jgi:STE24 endopeptidase